MGSEDWDDRNGVMQTQVVFNFFCLFVMGSFQSIFLTHIGRPFPSPHLPYSLFLFPTVLLGGC